MHSTVWLRYLLLGVIAFVLIFVVAYYAQPEVVVNYSPNVKLSMIDKSLNNENPSVVVTIDDTLMFRYDTMYVAQRPADEIFLDTGLHSVMVRTTSGEVVLQDNFHVDKLRPDHVLSISYHYHPPLEWYKENISGYMYTDQLKAKDWPVDSVVPWLRDSMRREAIRSDFPYVPQDRHFEIEFGLPVVTE